MPLEVLLKIVGYLDHLEDPQAMNYFARLRSKRDLARLRKTCRTLANAAAVPLFSTVGILKQKTSMYSIKAPAIALITYTTADSDVL